jgi:hypothetical protein|tara:strand:+ start:26 stop:274 length:249 start_codon:yes stop_codon:yes gene_type:complete
MQTFLLIGLALSLSATIHAALVFGTLAAMRALERRDYLKRCRAKADQLDIIELEAADAIGLTFRQFRDLGGSPADWTGYKEL